MGIVKHTWLIIFGIAFQWGNAQYISVDESYTAQQLIQDKLINSPCANVFNVSVSGGNFTTGEKSFGYFDTDEENAAVIVNIADSLNDNGYFLLDYLNAEYIKKNIVPFSTDSFETAIIESRRSIHNNTIVKNITVIPKDGEREEFEENVKLYTQPMLQVMIENSGFVIESIHGNYDGSDFDVELSPRCIIVAKKL